MITEYWGLDPKVFKFYDDNGEKLDVESFENANVEKIMETVLVRELKDKDLFPPGARKAVLYIGDDNFEETYRKLI